MHQALYSEISISPLTYLLIVNIYLQILAIFVLLTIAYCQDHHHQTFSHKSVVKHEIPKKVENYHHYQEEHKAPVQIHEVHAVHAAPQHHGHAVLSQSIAHHDTHGHAHGEIYHEAPKHYFIPAHQPAPVHETVYIQAPVHHIPVQHHVQQVARQEQQESHHKESHHKESHKEHHHEHYVDYYVSDKQYSNCYSINCFLVVNNVRNRIFLKIWYTLFKNH